MSQKLHVNSIEALQHLEKILGAFAGKTSETLDNVHRDMQRKLDWLENCCCDLQSEAAHWEDAYHSADEDDDTGYLAYKRDEAIGKMQQARRQQKRVEEAYAEYERTARRVDQIASERLMSARAFLRQKITELQNYAGLQLNTVNLSSGGMVGGIIDAVSNVMGATLQTVENTVDSIVQIALPKGFEWVPLDEISPQAIADLPSEDEYRKVSYESMKHGFEILQNDVLPAIKSQGAKINDDYFYNFDRENNREIGNSTEEIFKVFFGDSEPICLDRGNGTSMINITSGRHRIKVARDLGWTAIPAKII